VVLHGNDKIANEDIRGMGKAVGLNFSGVNHNMFDVLSRRGRKNKEGGRNGK